MREFRFLDDKRKGGGLSPIEEQRWIDLGGQLGMTAQQGYYGPDGVWYAYPPGYDPQTGQYYHQQHQGYAPPQQYYDPNAGYYPAQPPPPPAVRRTSPVVWVLAAMGLMAVLGGLLGTCGVVAGLVALGASSDDPGGVILGEQVPQKTVETLKSRKLLGQNEALLAYHDQTIRLDMSEVTFVTAARVVHARGETIATIALADVTKVTHRSQGLVGDVIEIATEDGHAMHLEIAPLNGGDSYVNVLEAAWKKHRPDAKVVHEKS